MDNYQGPFEPIAIIGMSCILPDSPNIDELWKNIISKHVSFKEIPKDRWDPIDFYDEEKKQNKTYSKIGAFVDGYEFDWRRWRQPPGTLPQIDICQQWAVSVSASALEHAGYLGDDSLKIPREKTSVIFANALGGENRNLSNNRVWAGRTLRLAKESGLQDEEQFLNEITKNLPKIDEDTMPGELANVVAGRVANLLDLQGPNYTTDAACASSMAAVLDACRLLQLRQVDMAIAGASDRTMDPATYAKFSAIGALSATHSTPFDSGANGFVMGEGAGAIVLKRLVDAISDGDTIYSVIRGIGASSDGRGKGITAPSRRGQAQAVKRAYEQAGYSVETVGLIEAHGTSTKVGDATELGTLNEIFEGSTPGNNIAVGSIKSQIGHLKAAAGIAGILKATLAVSRGIIPPSAGFSTPNETVNWKENPFYVPIDAVKWDKNKNNPLRAGISAFGFGGTNFHITIESYEEELHKSLSKDWLQRWNAYSGVKNISMALDIDAVKPENKPSMTWEQIKSIEGGVLLVNARDTNELKIKITNIKSNYSSLDSLFDDSPDGKRLSQELTLTSRDFVCEGLRLGLVATNWKSLFKKLDLILENVEDLNKWSFLSSQDIFITNTEITNDGKVAHLFPGQGSQYVGMTNDLSKRYRIIGETWTEADKTMVEILGGEKLSEFVLRSNLSKEEITQAELKLKQTEYTQPAMLTADLSINRLLEQHGQFPDLVAGHSLGEYAALMVSGILKFHDALRAAAARGTEMGSVEVPDKGMMASITAPFSVIEEVLDNLEDYVIPANKNSPLMTVIAGETEGVKNAIKKFDQMGINSVILPTSHAFHTRIVAPANEPLKKFLEGLEINLPQIPITSNYDGEFYPLKCEEGFSIKETILPQISPQMSSPVEWTRQIENMHDDGASIFLEVGPKRALTTFCGQILKESEHHSIMTNHPKQGGIRSFLNSLAQLSILGQKIEYPEITDVNVHTSAFSVGPIEAKNEILEPEIPVKPKNLVGNNVKPKVSAIIEKISVNEWIANKCSEFSGYPSSVCVGNLNLNSDLKMSDGLIEKLKSKISMEAKCNEKLNSAVSIPQLIESIDELPSSAVKVKNSNHKSVLNTDLNIHSNRFMDPYTVTGVSLGLPGLDEVFQKDTFDRIIAGENFISELSDEYKQRFLDKNLVRIVKDSNGNTELVPCENFEMIPQLAGRAGYFDLVEQYGIDKKISSAMDITTKLAFASGLEALRDAGLPLVAEEQVSSNGKRLVRGWKLPIQEQEKTGVIFASVFAGYDELIKHTHNNGADESGTFDRRFLLQVLSMGHSQFAQWIGAKGPNTAINNACASTPAAFSIAEDWISTGRASRVIIISSDNTTSDMLLEWIGSGFAAAGAHSIGNIVEEVSLPFDARRNGMLLGMGAAAFVVEQKSTSERRGVTPYCEILGSHIGNSAFHPTRLDVEHVSSSLDNFMAKMESNWGLDRHQMAPKTTFMSHEPATPPRGGSASAEVKALRKTFGNSAEKIVITNTKGFTGHPMGVGIEDAVAIYGLAKGRLPPIANFKQPDPELGSLRLSVGGDYDLDFALRHAAGFGSQMALILFKRLARTTNRIRKQNLVNWIENITGQKIELRIFQRKLVAWTDPDENLMGGVQGEEWFVPEFDALSYDKLEEKVHKTVINETQPEVELINEIQLKPNNQSDFTAVRDDEISIKVLQTVVDHTGYPADFIEFDQDLEGELGVDSVKQAEIMADLREFFELPVDENFVLSEYPTLNHMINYLMEMKGLEHVKEHKEIIEKPSSPVITEKAVESSTKSEILNSDPVINKAVLGVVVEHTGYPEDFIGFDQDLEGELGVDSVKQAEMMSDLRSKFNLPLDDSFILSEHPTLNHISSYISRMSGNEVVELNEEINVPELETKPNQREVLESEIKSFDDSGVVRWQVEVEEADELSNDELDVKGKTILITDEDWNLGEEIAELLQSRGARVLLLSLDTSVKEFSIDEKNGIQLLRANPNTDSELTEVAAYVTSLGSFGGIIHLAPLDLAGLDWSAGNNKIQTSISTTSLFNLLKELDSDFAVLESGLIVSVSAMDGRHGNRGSHFNPVAAGAHGIVKSYSKERPNIKCTALDIHPELISKTKELAKHILQESLSISDLVEIGLDRDYRRWRLVLFEESLIAEKTELTSDDIFLITGGGSGVTAASSIALSSASRNSNAKFILLGRTELITETSEWVNDNEEELNQRKLELREKLIQDRGAINIVEWENAWKPYRRSLDIHLTINAINSTGNQAEYFSCDVSEIKSTLKAVKNINTRFGAITGIIHGAGIEDSKLVREKDPEIFEKVVSIKVQGWINLINAIESNNINELKLACCFTSIAGRFGNAGQTDYSAANSILDAEMCRLNAVGTIRAIAIAWTGWRDVGMATKGSIEKVFEQAGIQTVGIERGVKLFVDEILRKGKRRVVIAGELGILDSSHVKRAPPLLIPSEISAIIENQENMSLIDYILDFENGKKITIETTFDVDKFPFLIDHSIEGIPYLPGVMALELFAQCSKLLIPDSFVSGFTDVSFGLPVKLTKSKQKVRVIAIRDGNKVECKMESDLTNSEGEVFGQPKLHHSAIVELSKTYNSSKKSLIGLPQNDNLTYSSNFIYSRFFHGPRFQSHAGIIKGISNETNLGADGRILQRHQLPNSYQFKLELEDINIKLESYPMLIESAFQNSGMVTMEQSGMQALPIAISSTTILRQPLKDANLLIRTICRNISNGISIHDGVIIEDTPDKPLVMILEGIQLKALAPLNQSMHFTMER